MSAPCRQHAVRSMQLCSSRASGLCYSSICYSGHGWERTADTRQRNSIRTQAVSEADGQTKLCKGCITRSMPVQEHLMIDVLDVPCLHPVGCPIPGRHT